MGQQTIPVLKDKFSDGKSPSGRDFGDVFDSYIHKTARIPQAQVLGLKDELDNKADKNALEDIEKNRKGYFSDEVELSSAYPNPSIGWYAYVGATGTVWNSITGEWVDTAEGIPSDLDLTGYAKVKDVESSSKNLSGDPFLLNGYINADTGKFQASDVRMATDYIDISTSDSITIKGGSSALVALITFYSEKKEKIASVSGPDNNNVEINISNQNIPLNAKYMRCSSLPISGDIGYVLYSTLDSLNRKIDTRAASGYLQNDTEKTLKEVELSTGLRLINSNDGGDFENGNNWIVGSLITDANVIDDVLHFIGGGEIGVNDAQIRRTSFSNLIISNSDVVAISIVAKSSNDATLYIGRGASTEAKNGYQLSSEFERYTHLSTASSTRMKFGGSVGGSIQIDSVIVLNLTSLFGADNIPNIEYIDFLLNYTGYFNYDCTVGAKVLIDYVNNHNENTAKQIEMIERSISEIDARPRLKVLLVGSSFGIDAILQFPVLAHHAGVDVVCGDLYSGGADIVDVMNNCINNSDFQIYGNHFGSGSWIRKNTSLGDKTFKGALRDYEWDIVIIQRGARNSHTWTKNQQDAAFYVLDYIYQNTTYNTKVYFNTCNSFPVDLGTGFTRQNQLDKTEQINNTTLLMQDDVFLDFIPNCAAVQNARNTVLANYGSRGEEGDLARDELHLDMGIGCYVTACTMFEKIIGKRFDLSIRNLDYLPKWDDVKGLVGNESFFTPITDEMSKVARYCALAAVASPMSISDTLPLRFPH